MPKVICDQCGETFHRNLFEIRKTKRHFCSRKCFGEWQSKNKVGQSHPRYNRVERRCKQCGESFAIPSAWIKKGDGSFCNRQCKAEWQKIHAPKKPFWVMRGEKNPAWRGGYDHYYGPNWQEQRRRARERDRYFCQRCGISEKEIEYELHVHHIIRFGDFGEKRYQEANTLSNLISLCRPCHLIVEHEQGTRPNPPH